MADSNPTAPQTGRFTDPQKDGALDAQARPMRAACLAKALELRRLLEDEQPLEPARGFPADAAPCAPRACGAPRGASPRRR